MEDKHMIDNIIKAKELLEDARCLSILHECDRGMVSPAEAHMYYAIRDVLKLLEQEVRV